MGLTLNHFLKPSGNSIGISSCKYFFLKLLPGLGKNNEVQVDTEALPYFTDNASTNFFFVGQRDIH